MIRYCPIFRILIGGIFLALCWFKADSARAQEKISLDSCLFWAMNNYPLVEQLHLIDLSRDYNIKNINTGYIPKADIMAFGGYIEGLPNIAPGASIDPWRFAGIFQLEQPIWDGGRLRNQKKIVKAEAEVDKNAVEVRLFEIKSKVSELYFSILLSQEQQNQMDLQIETLQNSLKPLQASTRGGVSFRSDAEEVEVKMLQTQQQKIQFQTAEKAYRKMLSIFIRRPIAEKTELEKPYLLVQTDNGFLLRPEMALFESRKTLLDAYNPGAGEVLPRLSLQGMGVLMVPEINLNNNNWNHFLAGGLMVRWPIGGRTYTMGIDKKRLAVEKTEIDKEKESFELGQKINLSQAEILIQQWDTLISYDNKIISILNRRTQSSESRYKNGVIPISGWLECMSIEGAARQTKALHEIQKVMAIYQYNRELGY